jgi:methylmalonyl-CoA mutase N-terminal domain/subunit
MSQGKSEATRERWERESYRPAVERSGERRTSFATESDLPVAPLYTGDGDPEGRIGFPGEFPFTRGIQPTMYRGRLWTMRQYAGFFDSRGVQRPLPLPPLPGANGPIGRLRPADADGV